MATANEVLILFTTALGAPADSEEQATLLGQVRAAIEKEPAFIPVLYSTILSVVPRGVGDILKRWIADTVEYVVARLGVATVNSLAPEQKVHRECDMAFSHHKGSFGQEGRQCIMCIGAKYEQRGTVKAQSRECEQSC